MQTTSEHSARFFLLAVLLCTGLASNKARAEIHVVSDLSGQAYSVPSGDGSWVSRRRLVEDLHLSAWNLVSGSEHPYYRGPRASFILSMRLFTDHGVTAGESDPGDYVNYIPGVQPLGVEITAAFASLEGLAGDRLALKIGRQIRLGTMGFFAFDGLEAVVHFPGGLDLHAYGGWEVRGDLLLGFDNLELDGTDSGSRAGLELDRYPDRREPAFRPTVGGEVAFAPARFFDLTAAFRQVGFSDKVADQRVGASAAVRYGIWSLTGTAVYNLLIRNLNIADVASRFDLGRAAWLTLEYRYFRPWFEGDSIFNVFELLPQNDVGGRLGFRLGSMIDLAGWAYAQLAEDSADLGGGDAESALLGGNGGLGMNVRGRRQSFSLRASGAGQWGEHRLGFEAGGRRLWLNRRLETGLRLSIWRLGNRESPDLAGNLAGYVVSVRFRFAQGASILAELENYYGIYNRPRWNALAALQLDLWR